MTDNDVPGFLAALGIPGIVDAHVHFLPGNLQEAVWRWFNRLTPPWPVTYRVRCRGAARDADPARGSGS